MTAASAGRAPAAASLWRATLAALCASFIGIGVARFAYTPLLPALIAHGWFGASAAAYLGATNLAGYLLGVLGAAALARRIGAVATLRLAMVAAAVSVASCAWPGGFAWFFLWRLVSGAAGGAAMVLAAPTVLPQVPPGRRGMVGGAIFMGVGLGIAVSATLVPLLLRQGLPQTWLALGGLCAVLTAIGWTGWPATDAAGTADRRRPAAMPKAEARRLWALYASYALNAVGLVPHMVFLVAYVARHRGLDAGAQYWELFGLGTIVGPILLGHLADRLGHRTAMRLTLAIETVFVGLAAVGADPLWLIPSSFVIGACTIGIVPVVLGRTREILHHHPARQAAAWRSATTGFALLQAAGAYGFSFLFSWSGGAYRLLFGVGAVAMAAALLAELPSGDKSG